MVSILVQVHRLHLCAAELLAAILAQGGSQCASSHPWASSGESHVRIQDRVRDIWEQHFGVSRTSTGHRSVGALLQELKSTESPAPSANVPLRQVQSPQSRFRVSLCVKVTPKVKKLSCFLLVCPQVQLYSSLHLTRAVLSSLMDDDGQLMKELWKAIAWFRDAEHFNVSAERC